MNLYEIVMKLIGPVDPVGAQHVDDIRIKNLHVLLDLTTQLMCKIEGVTLDNENHVEASMKKAAQLCNKWLNNNGIIEDKSKGE